MAEMLRAEVREELVSTLERSINKLKNQIKAIDYDFKQVTAAVKQAQENHNSTMNSLKGQMEEAHASYTQQIVPLNEKQSHLNSELLAKTEAIKQLREDIAELQTEQA